MGKFNPSRLPAPQPLRETRTFEVGGGEQWTLTLESVPDSTRDFALQETANDLSRQWVGKDAAPIPPVAGRAPVMTSLLCNTIALLMQMEVPEDGEEAYDLRGWIEWAVIRPAIFDEVSAWAFELRDRAREAVPNVPGASVA